MNIHKKARLTPIRREEMVLSVIESRVSKAQAARVYGVSAKIVSRWTARFTAQGRDGMQDRSSRPGHSPNQTGQALVAVVIAAHAASVIAAHAASVIAASISRCKPASRLPQAAGFCAVPDCRG